MTEATNGDRRPFDPATRALLLAAALAVPIGLALAVESAGPAPELEHGEEGEHGEYGEHDDD